MPRPASDYKLWVHSKDAPTTGTAIGAAGDEYSADEINCGQTYQPISGAENFGLNIEIMQTFTDLTSVLISIVHGAATAPTTVLASRYFVLADLVAGKVFFISTCGAKVKQFMRAYFDLTGTNPAAGKVNMWFGPRAGGAE